MTHTAPAFSPDQSLAHLAVTFAGASRVFHRHGLDFCCNGRVSLTDACEGTYLDPEIVIEEILSEAPHDESFERWDERPLNHLVDHLLYRYHEPHRAELPRLIAMARKVEEVHGDKASWPKGLPDHLQNMADELELHMQKEEQVLFPLIRSGQGQRAVFPVQVMEEEHREHGENLARLRELAPGFIAPEDSCETWRALYLGLAELEQELMLHIHLENNSLFPRALQGPTGPKGA